MIKFVCFDFDGVFTDGKIYYDLNGNTSKYYDVKDGNACQLLKKKGIKIGLISSFNNELGEEYTGISSNIISHLKFDYVSRGKSDKLNILNNWLNKLDIDISQVAYIGDDTSDIKVLEQVGFSACPNDAISECKNIVNYICNKKGGCGCVREFVDIILINKNNNLINEIKHELVYQLNNIPMVAIATLCNHISEFKNNIYFTGIGKSENIATHTCNLLKSIGLKCFYFNSMNALHGDIGSIKENDMLIMFSKSGNTRELLHIIPFLKNKKCFVYGICCNNNSKFNDLCDETIILPLINEINGKISTIPTNSYMSSLLFCNILVTNLSENINKDDYKLNHPAGSIGNKLTTIEDKIIYKFPKIILHDTIKLHNILLEMTKYNIGCCFFVDNNDILLGILTDGDIRRLLIKNSTLENITIKNINIHFKYEQNLHKKICDIEHNRLTTIPILNIDNFKIIGIIL